MNRAYSLVTVKSIDDEQRIIEGVASTPTPDRIGDVIEPRGAAFAVPLPLLWQHRSDQPIGRVLSAGVTDGGIAIKAQIAKGLLPEIDRAWALIKSGLVRGLSIGFRGLESEPLNAKDPWGPQRFKKWEWLELSAVTIPANSEASITLVRSLAAEQGAVSGATPSATTSGVTDTHARTRAGTRRMKTIAERKQAFVAEREAKAALMNSLMPEDGTTLEPAQQEDFDNVEKEIAAIDAHLARLETLDRVNRASATVVKATDPADAATSRSGVSTVPVITVKDTLPPGYGFARAVMVKTVAQLDHRYVIDVAKEMFPHDQRLLKYFEQKGAVPAANTQNSLWAGALTDQTNLASEFAEFLRPMTILGKFGTNGIPSLRRVPFNIRFITQTTGGEAWWVGEGAPKPLTSYEFTADTLLWSKVATIAVITQEQARFSVPSAEQLVRDALAESIRARLDTDFIDPAHAAVANVNPASITNGLTPLSSAGTSADNARTDVQNLLEQFIVDNVNVESLVLIMPNTLALALSLMVNSLGQQEFPGLTLRGGSLLGIPVITSQYAANISGAGNMVIALNANDILLADDGQVNVDMSTEASLEMLSNPTNNSRTATAASLVSMWQTNSIALKAERFIHWKKRRTNAVVYMDDVNWGAIGSPS